MNGSRCTGTQHINPTTDSIGNAHTNGLARCSFASLSLQDELPELLDRRIQSRDVCMSFDDCAAPIGLVVSIVRLCQHGRTREAALQIPSKATLITMDARPSAAKTEVLPWHPEEYSAQVRGKIPRLVDRSACANGSDCTGPRDSQLSSRSPTTSVLRTLGGNPIHSFPVGRCFIKIICTKKRSHRSSGHRLTGFLVTLQKEVERAC
jgi:hypothetical protein